MLGLLALGAYTLRRLAPASSPYATYRRVVAVFGVPSGGGRLLSGSLVALLACVAHVAHVAYVAYVAVLLPGVAGGVGDGRRRWRGPPLAVP